MRSRMTRPCWTARSPLEREGCDDGLRVTRAIGLQGRHVAVAVVEQPSGDGDGDVPRDARRPEEGVDEGAAGAPVAVGERVDRLELGMRHRGLREDGQVVPRAEGDEVVDCQADAGGVRVDEVGGQGRAAARPDPHRLGAPPDEVRGRLVQQRLLHPQDGVRIEPVGELDGGHHGFGVGHDDGCVAAAGMGGLGLGDGPGRCSAWRTARRSRWHLSGIRP